MKRWLRVLRLALWSCLLLASLAAALLYGRAFEPWLRKSDFALRESSASPVGMAFANAAAAQIGKTVFYDSTYVPLSYPGGDVPVRTGVCADVVIRALRTEGIDLQKEVHEDMQTAFNDYPHYWDLAKPDSSIDHRRVPNLMRYFQRHGKALPTAKEDAEFQPGDIVIWWLFYHRYHIGIVSSKKAPGTARPLIIHNIGSGAVEEDVLHAYTILGRYRW